MEHMKKFAIRKFIERIKSEKIKWPSKMKKHDRILFLNNLIEFSKDDDTLDDVIEIHAILKKEEGK